MRSAIAAPALTMPGILSLAIFAVADTRLAVVGVAAALEAINDRGRIEMSDETLARQLAQDAEAGVPPFGAESIDIARSLGAGATELLRSHIVVRDSMAFLALEALRHADPDAYRAVRESARARIYADALAGNLFFNAWGVPGYQLTETSAALISIGQEGIAAMRPLLGDTREAPLSGSQDATTSSMYGNRICDYAWVLISEILGRPYVYTQDPVDRDRQIAELRALLNSAQGAES